MTAGEYLSDLQTRHGLDHDAPDYLVLRALRSDRSTLLADIAQGFGMTADQLRGQMESPAR